MKVLIDKSFSKDSARIKDQHLLDRLSNCNKQVIETDKLDNINSAKRMIGENYYYRIRLGDLPDRFESQR
jgi:mRNA-degrading endonuclease RelE of RelBE toxin-antitoxin system